MRRLVAILLFIITIPLSARSQSADGGISCYAQSRITERWTIGGSVGGGYTASKTNCIWHSVNAGLSFTIIDSLYAFAGGTVTLGNYTGIDNIDLIWKLTEGISCRTDNLIHELAFDQRKLKYNPSGYSISCSRIGYTIGHDFGLSDDKRWMLATRVQILCNLKSDVSDSPLLQRVKISNSLTRQISKNMSAGLRYEYLVGGKRQSYVGEEHNMHKISIFLTIAR